MRERPILFSSPMVRAILEGRKTQTRRVVKPQPTGEPRPLSDWSRGLAEACHDHSPDANKLAAHSDRLKGHVFPFTTSSCGLMSPVCPYGHPGDRLWVRETWQPCGLTELGLMQAAYYKADGKTYYDPNDLSKTCKWRPSIHMPRWASRITLEITGVRVERLQDISEEDAESEAAERGHLKTLNGEYIINGGSHRCGFINLWQSIHGPGSWDANPWVWCISFQILELRNGVSQ